MINNQLSIELCVEQPFDSVRFMARLSETGISAKEGWRRMAPCRDSQMGSKRQNFELYAAIVGTAFLGIVGVYRLALAVPFVLQPLLAHAF